MNTYIKKGHFNSKKTHCPKGHAYTPDNTYVHSIEGRRACRTCNRERHRVAGGFSERAPKEQRV